MPKLNLRERLIDPNSPERRPRRAAFALPTLFTAGNVFLGYLSILRSFRGAMLASSHSAGADAHFQAAAIAIGVASFLDGFDGMIARLTNTTSDFGREMDSLADVISFGIAPAVLAFAWGVQFIDPSLNPALREAITRAGYFISFVFLLCGAARLARFNVQTNPVPKNPGRPGRKYFVGLPIPGAAAMVAAVVYASGAAPLEWWPFSVFWLLLLALLSFLMVSTWRYYSFKGLSLTRPRSYLTVILLGGLIYLIWVASQPVLLIMATVYVSSGIVIRVGGLIRRHLRHSPHHHIRSTRLADTIALIGGETLLGRELRDVLATAQPALDVKLIAGETEEAGTLTVQSGEPTLVTGLDSESLRTAAAILLASSPELSQKVIGMQLPAAIVDLTFAAEDDPRARLRAPAVEPAGFEPASNMHVIAHPAAIALALFLNPLHLRHRVRAAVVQVFEPASERGLKGLDELQQQTVSLLSFKGLPKAIFDAQLAFAMLARYGEEAPAALQEIELRIERHLATLLANSSRAPLPSLRLVQAPVFHGYSFGIWVDFEDNPGVDALEKTLAAAGVDVRDESLEPPNNAGIAGQSGIAVGAIAVDRNHPSACWVWMVADNLRLAAENAVAVAREVA